jgi:hypothetical protein
MAGGIDLTTTIKTALADAEREALGPVDELLDGVERARESYDKYTDDPHCGVLKLEQMTNVTLSQVDQTYLINCQLELSTAAINLGDVGVLLENAAS